MKTSSREKIVALRSEIEKATAHVLILVQRNEFIGAPVTPLEERIRKQRDRMIRAELNVAHHALKQLEKAAHA